MRHPYFLKCTARRFCSVLLFGLILAVTANAYTVVMRGGRRVEIRSQFVVTASTLTYEVSPGLQVTLALAAIDIAATEKANNEATGSLMRRVQPDLPEQPAGLYTPSMQTRRTITNRDLESSMQRRQASELAYESRRKELGLPSVEESRRRADAEADWIRSELRQKREVDEQSEAYWRDRADALRTEMAAVDAQIAYIRSRLEERPWFDDRSGGWSSLFFGQGGPSFGVGRGPFGRPGGFGYPGGFGRFGHRQPIFVAPNRGAQVSGRAGFGGGSSRGRARSRAHPGFIGLPVVGNISSYDSSYERSELITQFNQLGMARAGLNARWRELEDEARRAGAQPGWLRP